MNFKLVIPEEVHQKIRYLMNLAGNVECSGFGELTYDEKTETFTAVSAYMLEQENSGADTEMTADAISKAMFKYKDNPMAMKWHWHSHHNMGVFWSQTDKDFIKQMGEGSWILASVFNHKDELRTAWYGQVKTEVLGWVYTSTEFYDELETTIESPIDNALAAQWDKEFKANVIEKKWPTVHDYSKKKMSKADKKRLKAQEKKFSEMTDAEWSAWTAANDGVGSRFNDNGYWDSDEYQPWLGVT